MLLLLRIKGNAGITATHARCLAQPQHSGQQLRSCLLSQPRLEGMAPKVKKADKTEAAAKAKAAANKKKDQANMVTQLKSGRKRLQEAKEAGTDLPPAELEDLERRDSFLREYEALGLYNPRKTDLLLQWKQDKTLKTWAELDTSHSTFSRGTDRSELSYGTQRLGCISFLLLHVLLFEFIHEIPWHIGQVRRGQDDESAPQRPDPEEVARQGFGQAGPRLPVGRQQPLGGRLQGGENGALLVEEEHGPAHGERRRGR